MKPNKSIDGLSTRGAKNAPKTQPVKNSSIDAAPLKDESDKKTKTEETND